MLPDLPLHPMLVHFPIVLLTVGFAVDVAGLALKKDWLLRAGLLLLILGTLGAIAARQSGKEEEETIIETPAIEETLDTHEDSGTFTMWFFVGITLVRAALTFWKKFTPAMHWAFTILWAIGIALVIRTAYYGGTLVYNHGAGVAAGTAAGGSPGARAPEKHDD